MAVIVGALRPHFCRGGRAALVVTRTLARLRTERRQQAEFERIGWRALPKIFAALVVAATVTLSVNFKDKGGDFEPGVRSAIQMENFQVS